ncbi:MAG: RNA 2',3'-cyclic phosphodiesterase, partial [Nocardioides sp.]|nr:RNA 2',3'-cyclic phosphodiesterase [Nocardioides sp.]
VAATVLGAGQDLDGPGGTELERLAQGCRTAAARAGVEVDGQRFRPHLTVARTGRPQQVGDWVQLLENYQGPVWAATQVTVLVSHLGEGPARGPRYEVLAELPVGGPPA